MSDRERGIPAAAVDVTDYRRRIDAAAAADDRRSHRTRVFLEVLGLVGVSAAFAAIVSVTSWRTAIAVGSIILLVGLTLVVAIPIQLASRRARASLDLAATAIDDATSELVRHLASIGYEVPDSVALAWVTSPAPTATVRLVHDSVIAARWWRPAEGDDRIFVEPFLRRGGVDSTLPALPPR